ncbi:signal peptidase I [Candidatus Microgenomates bacterium]|nr:signal peptidase I [Candidatus Microgenomates bacterium]
MDNSQQMQVAYKPSSLKPRLIAAIIDGAIVAVPAVILFFIYIFVINPSLSGNLSNIFQDESRFETLSSWFETIYFVLFIAYSTYMLGRYGATFGKKNQRLTVVSSDYKTIGYGRALVRESIGKFVSSLILNIGYLWLIIDKKRQGWHDKISKTLVVQADETGKPVGVAPAEAVAKPNWLVFILVFLLVGLPGLALGFFTATYLFVVQPNTIAGESMYPIYPNKAYVLTEKISYRYRQPKRGDIVIFRHPQKENFDLIERIVGLPNEKISIQSGKVYINGEILDEQYLSSNIITRGGEFLKEGETLEIPLGYYFAMGDNRDRSSDSRIWGFVPRENIIGKVGLCYSNCSP